MLQYHVHSEYEYPWAGSQTQTQPPTPAVGMDTFDKAWTCTPDQPGLADTNWNTNQLTWLQLCVM